MPNPSALLQWCHQELWSSDRQTDTELTASAYTTHQGSAAFTSSQHGLCKIHPAKYEFRSALLPFHGLEHPRRGQSRAMCTPLQEMFNPLYRPGKWGKASSAPESGMRCNLLRYRSTSEAVKPLNRAGINLLSVL